MARLLVLLILAFALRCVAAGETLREVLDKHGVSTPLQKGNLDRTITSYAVLDDPEVFAIAYYLDDGSGGLPAPLFILKNEKASNSWREARLTEVSADWRNLKVECLGSALGFQQQGQWMFLDTHINPSAGCLIVLSKELSVKKTLYGWYLASFRGLVLFAKSQIHFAATHPLEISAYDPRTDRVSPILPTDPDPVRDVYVKGLRAAVAESGNRGTDFEWNPERFEGALTQPPIINEKNNSFAFVAHYYATGFGDKVEGAAGDVEVVYVFQWFRGRLRHRDFEIEDLPDFGVKSIRDLLEPPALSRVFAR